MRQRESQMPVQSWSHVLMWSMSNLTAASVKQEGWIHHLARHSVACYLTRGQCYISWERGTEVFDGSSAAILFCCISQLISGD